MAATLAFRCSLGLNAESSASSWGSGGSAFANTLQRTPVEAAVPGLQAGASNRHSCALASSLTACLQQQCCLNGRSGSDASAKLMELRAILGQQPAAGSLAVGSPPCRNGGACNPIGGHDRWARSAYFASHESLQVLRELEACSATPFLQGDSLLANPAVCSMDCQQAPDTQPSAQPSTSNPFQCHVRYFPVSCPLE